ncbi:MAG TPA: phage tail family protein [Candidatus Limosilactobacillus intestinavium]|nr:phage tail family protein [Candidatus Limosilactobacillus intestinavium]
MYKFRDLSIDREYIPDELPVEALNYGGHWLDREVPGFQTLVTSGRQVFQRQVNATSRVGDGDTYLSSRIESKKIEVMFNFKSDDVSEYNKRLDKLRQFLYQPNQPFYFADEQEYHYIGTVSELSLDKDVLNTTGKIVLTVSDPYQYGKDKRLTGVGVNVSVVDDELKYPQTPKTLVFTPTTTTSNLKIMCGNKKIELSIGVGAGQPVRVDFDNLNVSINNVDSLMDVTLDSNLSDFFIQNGSSVQFNANGNYELTYEVKKL